MPSVPMTTSTFWPIERRRTDVCPVEDQPHPDLRPGRRRHHQVRLARRGITLPAVVLGAGLAGEAFASLPASLVGPIVAAARLGAAEQAAAAGAVTPAAAAL